MPDKFIIIRQPHNQQATVSLVEGTNETTLFVGPRWPAKRFISELKTSSAYQGVRFFNQPRGRGGFAATIREI